MKTLIFIGTFAEGERLNKAFSYQRDTSPVLSGIAYTTSLWNELSKKYDKSISISNFPCSAYPYSKIKYVEDSFWDMRRLSASYLNMKFFRNISAKKNFIRSIKKNLLPYLKNDKDENDITIFLCDPWSPLVDAAVFLKKKLNKAKLIVDLPDLPFFTNRLNKSVIFKFFKGINAKRVMRDINKHADGFVFFSKNMCDFFNLSNRKYIVHEGIINPNSCNYSFNDKKHEINIVYTGSLDEASSNVTLMIKAIDELNKKSQHLSYNLYLAGGGHLDEQNIKNAPTVHYLGQLSLSKTKELQMSADILISLRPNTPEFNYAFPSKMFEYIECKRPIVCVKLDCFPELISSYCYLIKKLDVNSIVHTIESINFNDFYNNKIIITYGKIVDYYSVESLAKAIYLL